MEYLGSVVQKALPVIFIVFTIATVGYLIGSVRIKGISLGTAGVLLIALLFGIGNAFDTVVSLGAYVFLLKKNKINIFSVDRQSRKVNEE